MQEVIKQQLGQMKLYVMQQAYTAVLAHKRPDSLTHDELIHLLVQAEWENRENRKINRYMKGAKFGYRASIEEIDFDKSRNLDRTQLLRLTEGVFIQEKEDLHITGASVVGKNYIASALGYQAFQLGYRVLYFNTQKLFSRLKMSKGDGSYIKEINKIEKFDLLILDDFALQPVDNHIPIH
nr:ATP-binding protein [Chitinophaga silvisoli]